MTAPKVACVFRGRETKAAHVYAIVRRMLFCLPAEVAHGLAFLLLRLFFTVPWLSAWLRQRFAPRDSALRVQALGRQFQSPIGLAAGFDKDAAGYQALAGLGFGFIEVGTVTAQAQPGNPRPRLFRLPADRALINRMGFNNRGAAAMSRRLRTPRATVLGVNIGKSKVTPEEQAAGDYRESARLLASQADYLVVNVSSPNTPGLRNLQSVTKLRQVLTAVQESLAETCAHPPPLLVKIAPDLQDEELDAIVDLALELELSGIIATNTTIERAGLETSPQLVERIGAGGLSGAPLKRRALEVLERIRMRAGQRLTLISVGGIETVDDVWERLAAGAHLVQVYTSFVYGGPALPSRLNRQLAQRLRERGLSSVQQLTGTQKLPVASAALR